MENKTTVEKIMKGYTPKEVTKFDEFKALDKKVKRPAVIFAYVFGIIGALILGIGMCLAMGVIEQIGTLMILGIAIGLLGIVIVSFNYSIYSKILSSRKKKYADEVINIGNELLND